MFITRLCTTSILLKLFRNKGVVFIETLDEISDSSRPLVLSAHGVPQALEEQAKALNITYIDATCPLVKKVHKKVKELDKNEAEIVIIGKKNHQEIIGTKVLASRLRRIDCVSMLRQRPLAVF